MSYAEGTSVSPEKTRLDLDKLLQRHGADQRVTGVDDAIGAFCMFRIDGRHVRLRVPIPTLEQCWPAKGKEPRGWHMWHRDAGQRQWVERRRDQYERERWRALLLLVKAKLEYVALGLSTIEREFLADVVLPNGRNVHDELAADIQAAYLDGKMPKLLGMGP